MNPLKKSSDEVLGVLFVLMFLGLTAAVFISFLTFRAP